MSVGETTSPASAGAPTTLGTAVVVTALALALDVYIGMGLAAQLRTAWYAPADGLITSSEVLTHGVPGSGRIVHAPKISYTYVWGSRTYRGDHYEADDSSFSSGSWVGDLVAGLSPGTKVPVYVSPADASRAVLRRGLGGGDLLWPLFALPVNLLAVGAFASVRRTKRTSAPNADSPMRRALMALGALGVALPALLLMAFGSHPPLAVSGSAWLIAIVVSVATYVGARRRESAISSRQAEVG